MTAARALDGAAVALAAFLGGALLRGWWRPEDVFLALVAVVSIRLWVSPVTVPALAPRRVVAVGVLGYAAAMSFVTLTRHYTFLTHALDLGYYVQLAWNLAGGRGARVSLPEMHAWGDHLSPIMYLVAALFWVVPGPAVLLVAQSAALALGGVATFALARRWLGDERPAAALALLYMLNPTLHGINVRDFHAAALAVPLLLAAMHLAETGRWGLFVVTVAAVLACREDAALPVMGLGAWLLLARRRWAAGAITAAAALGVLVADVRWVIPHFRGEPYSHLWRYDHLGRSIGAIVASVLGHPLRTLGELATAGRLVYLAALLAPLAFLPLARPLAAVGAVPALVENLLSRDPILYHHRTQYQAFVLPFLVAAAIAGYGRLAGRRPGRWPVAPIALAMAASLVLGARTVNQFAVERWWPGPEHRAAYAVLARVPEAATVSAQDPYVPHLAMRERVFVFPVGIEASDHVLLNTRSYPWRSLPGVTMTRDGGSVRIALGAGGPEYRYRVAAEAGPHLLLRRP